MTYTEWEKDNNIKKKAILDKLDTDNPHKIVEYFEFSNMVKNEPDFCGLYATNTKCHSVSYLNCFNCACPYFKYTEDTEGLFKDGDTTIMSTCNIHAKDGKLFHNEGIAHQDCSACTIPHTERFTLNSTKNHLKDAEWS